MNTTRRRVVLRALFTLFFFLVFFVGLNVGISACKPYLNSQIGVSTVRPCGPLTEFAYVFEPFSPVVIVISLVAGVGLGVGGMRVYNNTLIQS